MGGLTALVWKHRREVYILTNMDPPRAEGNFLWLQPHPKTKCGHNKCATWEPP